MSKFLVIFFFQMSYSFIKLTVIKCFSNWCFWPRSEGVHTSFCVAWLKFCFSTTPWVFPCVSFLSVSRSQTWPNKAVWLMPPGSFQSFVWKHYGFLVSNGTTDWVIKSKYSKLKDHNQSQIKSKGIWIVTPLASDWLKQISNQSEGLPRSG